MRKIGLFTSEANAWSRVRGRQNRVERRLATRRFKKLFPTGHAYSLRGVVRTWCDVQFRREVKPHWPDCPLYDIHPRALHLLLQYGQDYTPMHWRHFPEEEPIPKGCYANAWTLTQRHDRMTAGLVEQRGATQPPLVYVEGIVLGAFADSMLHAWNARGCDGKVAFDWTFAAVAHYNRYIGLPFTAEEYTVACNIRFPGKPKAFLLLRRDNFPHVEEYLRDVLAARAATSQHRK